MRNVLKIDEDTTLRNRSDCTRILMGVKCFLEVPNTTNLFINGVRYSISISVLEYEDERRWIDEEDPKETWGSSSVEMICLLFQSSAVAKSLVENLSEGGVQVANQSQSFADSDSTRSSRGGTGYRGRARGSFQGRNHDETGLQTGYDGNQRQHGFNSNVGYSKNNVGYSQRTDNPIQAYNHVFTSMPQQVTCYTPITQLGSNHQFGSVSQSSGHPGLTLSPMSSGYPFGNSSQVYSSPNYSPSLMVTPTTPHSSTSGSGMSTNLVSSPTTAHFVSPLTASSSAASGSSTFLTQSGSLVASPGAGSSTADAIWYPDSGATHHITNDLSTLHSGTVYKGSDQLLMGNGGGVQICHIGQGSLLTRSKPLFLQKLLHVPTISKNLLSVSQLARENNVYFEFHPYECRVKDSQTRATLLEGSLTPEGLYKLVSPGSSTHQVSPMDNSSYLPLVSPPVVDVSRNRQVLSPVGVPAFVHEDSVVPTGGCGNASSHDSSVQPNVAVDVSVMSGHASEPLIDATHGGVGSPVLAELDTEVHATGHDEVGESCVEATAAVQNGIATSLCDGDLCPVEESEHYEVGDEAATLIPSVSATTEGLCEQHEVGLYVKKAAWNEVKLDKYWDAKEIEEESLTNSEIRERQSLLLRKARSLLEFGKQVIFEIEGDSREALLDCVRLLENQNEAARFYAGNDEPGRMKKQQYLEVVLKQLGS
ncbi:hypothetical protein GQ457_05G032650 [Hibiscus cannabinus]